MFKKTFTKALAAVVIGAASASALAQGTMGMGLQGMYAGANYSRVDASTDGLDDEASLNVLYGRVGAQFNDWVSAEARLGMGIGDDTVGGADVEMSHFYGAYARGGFPVGEMFYPYVVAGYNRIKTEVSGAGFSTSDTEGDIAYGLGADIGLLDAFTVNVEWLNYYDKDNVEFEGLSAGVSFQF